MRGVRVFSAMQECTLEIVLVCIKPKQDGKEYFLEVCCFYFIANLITIVCIS